MPSNRVTPDPPSKEKPSSLNASDIGSKKALANPAIGKLISVPADSMVKTPFISIPQDLGGLTVSGWLVPTVKSPFKGLPAFCRAFAAGTNSFDKNNHSNYQNNEDVVHDFQGAAAAFSGEN